MKQKRTPTSILLACIILIAMAAGMNQLWIYGGEYDDLATGTKKNNATITKAEESALYRALEKGVDELLHGEPLMLPKAKSKKTSVPARDLERPAALKKTSETMLFKSQFTISYNTQTFCPNYVCWRLTSDRAQGRVPRSNNFHPDLGMPEHLRIDTYDYNSSGYDRGHMCPAGDNKNMEQAMDESFSMTNICPQSHSLNAGAWSILEAQCRSWAINYDTLYICCGPIYDREKPKTIGRRKQMKVAVPDRFFKVVLTLGRVPKAIGFIYPNQGCDGDMREYAVSVDEVERVTGIDFFYQLDNKLERKLEKECNPSAWGI